MSHLYNQLPKNLVFKLTDTRLGKTDMHDFLRIHDRLTDLDDLHDFCAEHEFSYGLTDRGSIYVVGYSESSHGDWWGRVFPSAEMQVNFFMKKHLPLKSVLHHILTNIIHTNASYFNHKGE